MHFLKHHHRFVCIFVADIFDLSISDLLLNLLLPVILIVLLYSLIYRLEFYPNGLQNCCEAMYELSYDFLLKQVGPKSEELIPYLMGLMWYIIMLNLLNLCPWIYGATSQVAVNLALAAIVFVMVLYAGFKHYGFNIFKHFVLNVPFPLQVFLFVLDIIAFLVRPCTLAARLAINVLVGHMLLSLLGQCVTGNWPDIFVLVFSIGLSIMEIFVAFLQAYIFIILACVYISEMSNGH